MRRNIAVNRSAPQHHPGGSVFRALIMAALLFLVLGSAPPLAAEESAGIWTLVLENDMLRGTDRHFTHGSRISYYSGVVRDDWLKRIAELLPYFAQSQQQESWRTNLSFGQNLFTPADISVRELQPEERPYAGYLYVGMGLVRAEKDAAGRIQMVNNFELQLGVVGPYAMGQDVQIWWHDKVSGSQEPMGWDNQLRNEPVINLYWDRQWRHPLSPQAAEGVEADLIPHAGLALGNADIHLGGGLTWRLGKGLGGDNGPPRIRPSLPGAGYFRKTPGWSGYLFVGMEGRLVGRNIFLDGNTFRDSHRVDRKILVLDAQYGLVATYDGIKVALTSVVRSQEFDGQRRPDRFIALSVSLQR